MDSIMKNWKTSVGGLIIIVLGALASFVGIKVPGFSMDFGVALTTGLALLFARDAAV